MNFANYIDAAARDRPEATALSDPTREVTFAELAHETSAFANALEELGVDAGERVALYLPNSVAFVAVHFGAMKRGAIPVPLNLRFTGREIQEVLADSGAAVVVTEGRFEETIADLNLDSMEHLVVANGSRGHDYTDLVASAEPEYSIHPRKQDELAELLYTSGTTGRSKGVKHTHGNLTTNALALNRYMQFNHHKVGLTVCPCFHVAGLNVTTTPLLVTEAENHMLPEWDPETVLATIENRRVTTTMLIPTMVLSLLDHGPEGYDLSALETVIVGASPMPKERIEAFEETFDVQLFEGYGMTEMTAGPAINRPGQEVYKPGSVGPLMEEVAEFRIEDPETHEEVGPNERGELLWYGDTVTPGYYNLPGKNGEAFVERGGKRWLRSGDIGHVDEDGHLFIDDRVDDMIVTGGENVYPREVEDVIYELDDVAEVGVIGTSDDQLGEQVTAIVVQSNDSVTSNDIKTVCRERLADYKVPRVVHFTEELPKTSTRKIDKVRLRQKFA